MRLRIKQLVLDLLRRLEAKVGFFLPYGLSEKRNDEFFHTIEKVAREEDIKTVLVIGAASGEGTTEALLRGIMGNQKKPTVFCVNGATRHFVKLEKAFAVDPTIGCVRTESSSAEHFSASLMRTIKAIKREIRSTFLT